MKWLRRYNAVTNKWTNQCYPYSDELAKDIDMRLVDEEEAKKCQAALLEEKKAACAKNRADMLVEPIIPMINKVEQKRVVEIAPDGEGEEPVMDLAQLQEVTKTVDLPELPTDDLGELDREGLRNIIDNEGLDVKKNLSVEAMIPLIREARKAKG